MNESLTDEEIQLLFKSLSRILDNQDKIMKHFGLNPYDEDWGYDERTSSLSEDCYRAAGDREHESY